MKQRLSLLIAVALLAGTLPGLANAGPLEDIEVCARITNADARLACYDRIGKAIIANRPADVPSPQDSVVGSDAAAATAVPATAAPATAIPAPVAPAARQAARKPETPSLPENLGGTHYEKKTGSGTARGLVTSCRKGADKRWYFYFDSGQVWRESNTSKRRFKTCHFLVTITRDGLGYKMQIDGKKSKIRVARRE